MVRSTIVKPERKMGIKCVNSSMTAQHMIMSVCNILGPSHSTCQGTVAKDFNMRCFILRLDRSSGSRPPLWCLHHIYLDTSHSAGLLWKSDQLVTETSIWQHKTLTRDRHPAGIWTRNPNKSVAVDPGLRPRYHRDQPTWSVVLQNLCPIYWMTTRNKTNFLCAKTCKFKTKRPETSFIATFNLLFS
jgi:hypothetical protein